MQAETKIENCLVTNKGTLHWVLWRIVVVGNEKTIELAFGGIDLPDKTRKCLRPCRCFPEGMNCKELLQPSETGSGGTQKN